jgi:predicted Zn-dependent protease
MQKLRSLFTRSVGAAVTTLTISTLLLAQGGQSSTPTTGLVVLDAPPTILKGFETSKATMQDLSLPRTSVAGFEVKVSLGGKEYELVLRANDVRAKNFKLIVVDKNGMHVVPTPPNTTYQGVVSGYGESAIAASVVDGQITAIVQFKPTEAPWNVQPLTTVLKGAARMTHVMHQAKDSTVPNYKCGSGGIAAHAVPNNNPTTPGAVIHECEIACDADFEEYQRHGSVINTQNDVASIINACNVIYKRDVEVEYKITQTIVRTTRVYAASLNYSQLLSAYRSQWINNHGGVKRDISHLFTAKGRSSSVIGVAYLSSICSTNIGYGLSYTHFTSNFTSRVGLTAHELGHSFGANHCSGSACYIMCAGLGGCGRSLTQFGTASKSAIIAFRDRSSCLSKKSSGGPIVTSLSPSVVNAFRGGTITATGSQFTGATKVRVGAVILTPGSNPKLHFTLVSDTVIRFESPTAKTLVPMPVTVETSKGVSPIKSYGLRETEPPLLEATSDPARGGLMLWEFGAGVYDTFFLTVSTSPITFKLMGQTWMNNAVILTGGNLSFAGYGSLVVNPVPTSNTLGLVFYSQVVTINKFPAIFDGNTNVTKSKIK